MAMRYCSRCGVLFHKSVDKCDACGGELLEQTSKRISTRQMVFRVLFCILLGVLLQVLIMVAILGPSTYRLVQSLGGI